MCQRVWFKERFTQTELEQRPQILVKLSFRELYGSNSSGLCGFDNMVTSLSQKGVKIWKVDYEFMRHLSLK